MVYTSRQYLSPFEAWKSQNHLSSYLFTGGTEDSWRSCARPLVPFASSKRQPLSIHPPVRIATVVGASETTANRWRSERANGGAFGVAGSEGAQGERERERESETGALVSATRTRRDRTSRRARCGNDRASTKRPTRSFSCARDVHRVASLRAGRISEMRRSRPSPIVRVRYISVRSLVCFVRPSLDFSMIRESVASTAMHLLVRRAESSQWSLRCDALLSHKADINGGRLPASSE